jgi:hypothetical protein
MYNILDIRVALCKRYWHAFQRLEIMVVTALENVPAPRLVEWPRLDVASALFPAFGEVPFIPW